MASLYRLAIDSVPSTRSDFYVDEVWAYYCFIEIRQSKTKPHHDKQAAASFIQWQNTGLPSPKPKPGGGNFVPRRLTKYP